MIIGNNVFTWFRLPNFDRKNAVEISSTQIKNILKARGCTNTVVTDDTKEALSFATYKQALDFDIIKDRKYISEIFDCDDFTASLFGTFTEILSHACFGIVHVDRKKEGDKHALMFCIDNEKNFWYIEPQAGVLFYDSNYAPYFAYC